MNAMSLFQIGNQAINRRSIEGIAANQERMKTKDRTQALIAHELAHQTIDTAIAAQSDNL